MGVQVLMSKGCGCVSANEHGSGCVSANEHESGCASANEHRSGCASASEHESAHIKIILTYILLKTVLLAESKTISWT